MQIVVLLGGSCSSFDVMLKFHKFQCQTFKDTRYALSKNSTNQEPVDILTYNSANKPSFKNLTKYFLPNSP